MQRKIAILLLLLLTFSGVGLFRILTTHGSLPAENLPVENLRIFLGYENYLNREIYYATSKGTSMMPTFGPDDVIIWVEVDDKAQLKENDIIIMYKHPTRPHLENIAHRIVDKRMRGRISI